MTNDSYIDFLKKLDDIKNKYSTSECAYLRLKSVEQFAYILNSLYDDESMRIYYGKKLYKYLISLEILGSSTLNKKYVEKKKGDYYYPVLRYLHKRHNYFRSGWWGIIVVFYLPLDILIYILNPFEIIFFPILSLVYFIWMLIKYSYKKTKGMVLIEYE